MPKIQEMIDKDRSPEDPNPPEVRSWEQARKYIEQREIQKKEEQKKKEWERKEQERLKRLDEEEQHRRDMLSRMSRRPAIRRRKQKDDGQNSAADTDSDTRVYSDGEGFELVKQRGFKKRRTHPKKGPAGSEMPGTSKEPPVIRPKQTQFPEPEEDQRSQSQQNQPSTQSSPVQSPQTSPYHPDIGESNGTVLGTDIQDETSTSDYEDTKSQEEKKQEEEEEEEMPTETQLTDSYPQPGQQHQLDVTATPKETQGKTWAEEMDDLDHGPGN